MNARVGRGFIKKRILNMHVTNLGYVRPTKWSNRRVALAIPNTNNKSAFFFFLLKRLQILLNIK